MPGRRAAKALDVAGRDELLVILSERARAGNVSAAKALLEELRRDASEDDKQDPFAGLDELAPRRQNRAQAS